MRVKDETGNVYGKLTVLEYAGNRKWKCKCECGNITLVYGKDLRIGKTKSCGCLRKEKYNWNDLTGKKFGRLIAKKYLGNSEWLCECECGNEKITNADYLREGSVKSCGCIEENRKTLKKHVDDKRTKRLYSIWKGMKQRCYRKKDNSYKLYGEKGIKICDEWLNFNNFYKWAIENGYEEIEGTYGEKLSIDRIDNNKDYCPENCRWVKCAENSANVSITNKQLEEILSKSNDEMIQNYIERKMELNKEIQEEKKITKDGFFVRKNNYIILRNNDNTLQYLFKNYKTVSLFLNISKGAISYRINKKNGVLTENWKLEKINKEEFEMYRRKGVEVII